jgi:hypothetical protein
MPTLPAVKTDQTPQILHASSVPPASTHVAAPLISRFGLGAERSPRATGPELTDELERIASPAPREPGRRWHTPRTVCLIGNVDLYDGRLTRPASPRSKPEGCRIMGFIEDLFEAGSDIVETVAEVVEEVVETTGDIVADVVETAGNAVADVLKFAGDSIAAWVPFMPAVTSWLGNVVAGVTNLAAGVVKGVVGIVGGVLAGLIRLLGGMLFVDSDLAAKGLIGIVSSITGAIALVAGQLLGLVQRIFYLQSFERPLTKEERAIVGAVFYGSLSLYNIRVVEGWSGAFGVSGERALTLGNTIYFKNNDPVARRDILIHECVHAWQYQNLGGRYTSEALGAQAIYGDPYKWEDELTRGTLNWKDFNKEAQAELIDNVWLRGSLTANSHTWVGKGAFYDLELFRSRYDNGTADFEALDGTNYTKLAIAAATALRSRINVRLSKGL